MIVVSFAAPGVADAAGGHVNFGWEMGWTARSVAEGQGYSSPFLPLSGPTAMMPPLYPWLLAGVFRLFRRLLVVFPVTYYMTHPLMDYRQPIEPEITILVAAAVVPRRLLAD
ncbi:MAG TPA: hypothetical protein VNW54_10800 [Granulicella sp.]|nr:hypothetical protein [Granulicella sp.]